HMFFVCTNQVYCLRLERRDTMFLFVHGNTFHRRVRSPVPYRIGATMNSRTTQFFALLLAVVTIGSTCGGAVVVKTEQLNPASPDWSFKHIPGPSKSDVAA